MFCMMVKRCILQQNKHEIVLIKKISDFCHDCGDKFVIKFAFLYMVCIRKGTLVVLTDVQCLIFI